MTADNWIAVAGIVVSIVLARAVTSQANHSRDLKDAAWKGAIGTKVDAMWRIMFRNAAMEGLDRGLLEQNSPIRANLAAFNEHPQLIEKLKEFYEKEGSKLDDLDLLVQIETRFSRDLMVLEQQHGLRNGASLAAACYLIRPGMALFGHFHLEPK